MECGSVEGSEQEGGCPVSHQVELQGVVNTGLQVTGEEVPLSVLHHAEDNGKVMAASQGKAVYSKVSGTEQSPLLQYDALSGQDPASELKKNPTSFRISQVILGLVFVVAGVALVAGLGFGLVTFVTEEDDLKQEESMLGVLSGDPGSRSAVGEYRFAAVAADAGECSTIGTKILAEKHGSAVDAAIASLLCLGLHNAHSMGIGGGHFMMIYDVPRGSKERRMVSLDGREMAPLAAHINMFANASSSSGGLSTAVPGEIRSFHYAWQRFGRLPWRELFEPALRMCREGYVVKRALAGAIQDKESSIRQDKLLSELYVKADGTLYQEGDTLKAPRLADTLEKVANEGPDTFYNGSLSNDIVADLKDCGAIITHDDLRQYKPVWRKSSVTTLKTGNLTVNTMPPPSSGPALQYMLNILEGFNLTPADISEDSPVSRRTLTYHRIVETFKFGYARRSFLADPDFDDVHEFVANMTSRDYADKTRSHITERTHDPEYYHPANHPLPESAGTSHLSIVGPDGEAVAATSTINTYFGSKCGGRRTGIIFNNEMDDFNTPGDQSKNGFTSSSSNFIAPGKRPLSSMVPTIILDQAGEPVYVLGGSGGMQITTEVTYVAAHALWLGKHLNDAIDTPRLHHALLPNVLIYEPDFNPEILKGLQEKGHVLKEKKSLAVIQGIFSCRSQCKTPGIYATSDVRKGGYPDGY